MEDEFLRNLKSNVVSKLNSSKIDLYHGTYDKNFVVNPMFQNPNNDYGSGLYLTPNLELAKEWSVSGISDKKSGTVIHFTLDTNNLNILDLDNYNCIYWATTLANNRIISDLPEVAKDTLERLSQTFNLPVNDYDVIKGYRADDSYFTYVRDFLIGGIYLDTFEEALRLGKLGIQYCIKSQKAFNNLLEVERLKSNYQDRIRYVNRDNKARQDYKNIRHVKALRKVTVFDILRENNL